MMWLFLTPTTSKTVPVADASTAISLMFQVALMLGLSVSIASLLVRLWFISIFLTTHGWDLDGISIVFSVAIVAIITISASVIASSAIAYAAMAISSEAYTIAYIIILAAVEAAKIII